ncbi:MAG: DNA helicase UvrD [Candidatus Buchananbacteria bacterium RIFCSPHIGHO2_01_FULL_46_12]|uniref:DNA helicase UvrD n=2 Tax=Candidatus Buchananiibacteriota TaxID=1817903 RepID=A0A1G1Y9Y5_9BACT|nr:MAG: DNA helicase UvrD [Candidatus Buchananbacteria bacterium RIFCSPHIGHO2_01_FULL_46_12]OGY56142.1 MAG: DNA helicase UvrD [Candidatus Buchananbacteria bacterium RIFCSPLOWO2_02_FULL_46_11b]
MRIIADLHIHSKYSRACSKDLDLEHISQWAKWKGIDIVACADWTHPAWLKELKQKLVEDRPGLYRLKADPTSVLFMLNTEVSCIYTQGGKCRRIHLCLFAPDFETIDKIIIELEKRKVNLKADGRPIMGLSAIEVVKIVLAANPASLVVPAHVWTPWFSVFGSYSGFDSLNECFGDQTKYIYAIETGLSSDPAMNWRLSALDKIALISNSDAHSPANLGREANVFEILEDELSFEEICRIIKEKDKKRFLYTIEFFPEEGKYHWDGHAKCEVQFSPAQTKKNNGLCPVCKKPLTVGVLNRVEKLAGRLESFKPNGVPYKSLVPLAEIIAEALDQGKNTKKVAAAYFDLIKKGGSEFKILLDLPLEELAKITLPEVAQGIKNVREGRVEISAGYDGVYGVVKVFKSNERKQMRQKSLF